LNPIKISVDIGENYNDPQRFVECAVLAEKYGFDTVWFGDHFMPWFHGGKKSSFVWSVMAVALDRTRKIKVGPDVTCPIGGRFPPAIVAQASATLDNMYPGRFQLGVGSGEAINEAGFFANGWPKWNERIERLAEAVTLMRRMWEEEEYFSFDGKYFSMKDIYLYTKPKARIPVYFSAIGEKAASFAGIYGDHLVTMGSPERCSKVIFPAFEQAAEKAGKDVSRMEKMVLVDVYFGTKEEGLKKMRETGEVGSLAPEAFGVLDPRKIEEIGHLIGEREILGTKVFCSNPDEIVNVIESYAKKGANHIALSTNSFPDKIQMIGEQVLPHFQTK
jgi:coenzyme F420-dependent glucose-6-phosphate dehydrogenase